MNRFKRHTTRSWISLGHPGAARYAQTWDYPLPASRSQSFDDPGRPQAHREFQLGRVEFLGTWPNEDRRWKIVQDYYLNCIQDVDGHIETALRELENQGLLDDTIVVLTADHGEMSGAHQMDLRRRVVDGSCPVRLARQSAPQAPLVSRCF